MIEKYAELTHASTHNMYTLSIEELFKIERKGKCSSTSDSCLFVILFKFPTTLCFG